MKRDISHAEELLSRSQKEPLLKKQLQQISSLPEKEYAHEAVRLGRTRGLYFNESDWLHISPSPINKKAA